MHKTLQGHIDIVLLLIMWNCFQTENETVVKELWMKRAVN